MPVEVMKNGWRFSRFSCPRCLGGCRYGEYGTQECCWCLWDMGYDEEPILCGYCENREQNILDDWYPMHVQYPYERKVDVPDSIPSKHIKDIR